KLLAEAFPSVQPTAAHGLRRELSIPADGVHCKDCEGNRQKCDTTRIHRALTFRENAQEYPDRSSPRRRVAYDNPARSKAAWLPCATSAAWIAHADQCRRCEQREPHAKRRQSHRPSA